MYNSKVSSSELYHFTKESSSIQSILENGFYPRCVGENLDFLMPKYKKCIIGIPMVCFCDIPLEVIEEHTKQYGSFGIAMKKEWGIKNGLNPVHYIQKGTFAYTSVIELERMIVDNAYKLDNGNLDKYVVEALKKFWDFASYLKVYTDDPTFECKPYYDEREWRYVVESAKKNQDINGVMNRLTPHDYADQRKRNELNKRMEIEYKLKFNSDDIEYLIVPSKEEIDSMKMIVYKIRRFTEEEKEKLVNKIQCLKS